jgi:hypothetical protein
MRKDDKAIEGLVIIERRGACNSLAILSINLLEAFDKNIGGLGHWGAFTMQLKA